MTGSHSSSGQGTADQPTLGPADRQAPVGGSPPAGRARWPMLLLGLSVVLTVAGTAIIVVLVSSDSTEVATRPDGSAIDAERAASTVKSGRDPNNPDDDDEPPASVTLPDRDVTATSRALTPDTSGVPATPPPAPEPANPAIPAPADVANKYVAIVWSESVDVSTDADLTAKVAEYREQFGDVVFGLHGDSFASLGNHTVAVAVDNGFSSALQGAEWCLDRGLSGNAQCFGVVLNDSTTPAREDRGAYTRWYPEQLS